jgi:hypothetical protein
VVRRLTFVVLVALASGCGQAFDAGGALPDDDRGSGGEAPAAECTAAEDCVLAAATCCECPSFAVPADSDYADACDAVACPPPVDCPAVEATCGAAGCELSCSPVVTAQTCPAGFERDALGCLIDVCAASGDGSAPAACTVAADCVKVAADCCGCARGGDDTAVAAAEADDFTASLGCTGAESCPEVDTCEAGAEPTCVAGRCALVDSDGDGQLVAFCGTPDYPACPAGTACVLNGTSKDAAALGVGSCQAP